MIILANFGAFKAHVFAGKRASKVRRAEAMDYVGWFANF